MDIVPVLCALEYNSAYQSLVFDECKLTPTLLDSLCIVLSRNTRLRMLAFHRVQLAKDALPHFIRALDGLVQNANSKISMVDISGLAFDLKWTGAVMEKLTGVQAGLDLLRLNDCSLVKRGMVVVLQALKGIY
jgi:hypothetical protein